MKKQTDTETETGVTSGSIGKVCNIIVLDSLYNYVLGISPGFQNGIGNYSGPCFMVVSQNKVTPIWAPKRCIFLF